MDISEIKDPKPEILEFVDKHKNELVLSLHEVVRLVGFKDIENDDYYYECHSLNRGKHLVSCVGALYPLKGVLPDKDYNVLVHIFDLNIGFALRKQKLEYLEMTLENLKKQGLSIGYVFLDPLIGTVDSVVHDSFEDAENVLNCTDVGWCIDNNVRIVPIIDYESDD